MIGSTPIQFLDILQIASSIKTIMKSPARLVICFIIYYSGQTEQGTTSFFLRSLILI